MSPTSLPESDAATTNRALKLVLNHDLNLAVHSIYFRLRICALCSATILALAALFVGAGLVHFGTSVFGVALLITAIAGLIGTAVYGHKIDWGRSRAHYLPRN